MLLTFSFWNFNKDCWIKLGFDKTELQLIGLLQCEAFSIMCSRQMDWKKLLPSLVSMSPDLWPLNFFFWVNLKNTVYKCRRNHCNELKASIVQESSTIQARISQRVSSSCFEDRLWHCIDHDGDTEQWLLSIFNLVNQFCQSIFNNDFEINVYHVVHYHLW